jgi:probable addiction module antidote protein
MTSSRGQGQKASAPASVPDRPHRLKWLKNAENTAAYVEAVIEEGDSAAILHALRNVVEARGGVARTAKKIGLSRESLYRTLSKRGSPELKSFTAILDAMGLRLGVTAKKVA